MMINRIAAMVAAWLVGLASLSAAQQDGGHGPDYTIEDQSLKISGVGPDSPVLYDNDWWLDAVGPGFAAAQHELGRMDLRGFIVTADMSDGGEKYTLQPSVDSFINFRDRAIRSGWESTPDYAPGAADPLQKPASGAISDTRFISTAGSDVIIEEAMKASPDEPLVVAVGGAPTTIATALLEEPQIAERMIVLWLAPQTNVHQEDQWAAHVMLQRVPVVRYHMKLRDGLTREMLESLPKTPLNEVYRNSVFVYHNGIGDGVLLAWLSDPSLITGAEQQELTGLTSSRPTAMTPYDFLHIPDDDKRSTQIAQYMIDALAEGE